jgi:homoserine dehydrogenase
MQAAYRPIRIGLLGAGSVGSQVARLLIENREELAKRVGAELELVGIAVRNKSAKRDVDLPKELITEDAESVILGSDIVIELAGGIEPAKTWIKMALNAGADVITANKALIAAHGTELTALAQQFGAQLYYEAAVGGAIPIIRPLRASLAGDKINRVMGIVNGTTNYILDQMETTGASFADALNEAQAAWLCRS